VREVDEKNETEEDENRGSDEGNIISPEHEETVWNEEADHDKKDPQESFRTPPSEQAVSAAQTKGKSERTHSEWRPFYREYPGHR